MVWSGCGITHHCAEAIDRTPCDSVLEVRFPRLGGGEGLDRAHAGGAGSSQEDDVKLAVPLGGQAKARHGLSGKTTKGQVKMRSVFQFETWDRGIEGIGAGKP